MRLIQLTTTKLTERGTVPTSAKLSLNFLSVPDVALRDAFGARADLCEL